MAQPLDVLIDDLITAWYKQQRIPRHHDIQDLVNHVYMNFDTSGNIKAYNSRRTFLELVHIPTDDDVSDWCFRHCAAKWVPNPSGGFKRIFSKCSIFEAVLQLIERSKLTDEPGMFSMNYLCSFWPGLTKALTGQPQVVSPEELRRDYIFQRADLKFRIWQFLASEEGYANLHRSSMNRSLSPQERIDEIMALRRRFGIPTKTKVTAGTDGRVTEIEYDGPKGPFDEQVVKAIWGSD